MNVDIFFDAVTKNDEKRMKLREVVLDALEARCRSVRKDDETVAVLAAIRAERIAIAATRKMMSRISAT